jgi:hypothetical protein
MSQPTTVKVSCRRCGELVVDAHAVRVTRASQGAGMFLFNCPSCTRDVWQEADPATLLLLRSVGVGLVDGLAPLELVEPHAGPSISWDEVLDAQSGMRHSCCPQDELTA